MMLLLYLGCFFVLHQFIGQMVAAMSILIVLLTAWFFGLRPAIVTSLICGGLSYLLFSTVFIPQEPINLPMHGILGLTIMLFTASITGYASDTRKKLQKQLADRQSIEKALVEANTALRESEQVYRRLFNETSDALLIYDLNGKLLKMNQAICGMLGYSAEALYQLPINRLIPADEIQPVYTQLEKAFKDGPVLSDTCLVRQDGAIIPVEVSAQLVDYNGVQAIFSIARDVSERKAIERSMLEQRALTDALRDTAADLAATLDLEQVLDLMIDTVNKVIDHDAATLMVIEGSQVRVMRQKGYAERGFFKPIREVRHSIMELHTLHLMFESQKPLVITDTHTDARWVSNPSTTWVRSYVGAPILLKGQVIGFLHLDHADPGFYTSVHAERLQAFTNHAALAIQNAQLYAELQQLALMDDLTGLYNRRGLVELGQREIGRAIRFNRPLTAMMIDVDNFKLFNDRYSYAVGDEVLATLARRIKSCIREVDLACRYGGDEFLILLTENSVQSGSVCAERVRAIIESQPFQTSRGPMDVTVSIGVIAFTADNHDLAQLIEAAGDALHAAKQAGRNQVSTFQPSLFA